MLNYDNKVVKIRINNTLSSVAKEIKKIRRSQCLQYLLREQARSF